MFSHVYDNPDKYCVVVRDSHGSEAVRKICDFEVLFSYTDEMKSQIWFYLDLKALN